VGTVEDQNLNKSCVSKAIKCCHHKLMVSVLSITLQDIRH